MKFDIRPAVPSDLPSILNLLQESGLPFQDVDLARLRRFLVADAGSGIAGCVGLECHAADALLRSLAVQPAVRHAGLGSLLAAAIEEEARGIGVTSLYLLTMTAADFFARRGYRVVARTSAPQSLQQTTEFAGLCPSQAVCLHKRLT
ncbi:GNAT family N-acetyltransferase [Noviherbaspirillum cavernae]|uniref:GNAT family N-acetyltransferase n=1 Tax=Noviherbaspirillum cavernae TaxID=2320862 RepID=A0A418WWH4_9BURK|nr:arsenic resistance N-acetyltransferase ArsN2 [Noviherbaspirillum cavernae]RJF97066.1 GNAT family N-acetyltransferase [Noviherbaspirillum cavernae]